MNPAKSILCSSALALAGKGWQVFPLRPNEKKPQISSWPTLATTNVEQILEWWARWPECNIGIAAGEGSNLVILDIDVDEEQGINGFSTLANLVKLYGALPPTIEVITGDGGRHLYFRYPSGQQIRNSAGHLGSGLDIRGEGGYVVAPPSIHPKTGRIYDWRFGGHPDGIACAEMPEWLILKLINRKICSTFEGTKGSFPNGKIPMGGRNSHLASLAGSMRKRGMSQAAIEAALLVENQMCVPPLGETEVKTIAASISQYESGRSHDDPGLIKEMADRILFGHFFAKDPGELLYHYESGCYRPTGEGFISTQFQKILEREGTTKYWSSHRARELAAYISIQSPRLWDMPRLDLLNLENGLYHIFRQQLLPHDPTHLSQIQLPVRYDSQATCQHWTTFLKDVLAEDTHQLVKEIVAHLTIPDMDQQKAFLFFGEGSNGKSTFIKGLQSFLGTVNVSTISLQKLEADRFATARLVGKLANLFADLPAEHLITSSIFKAITGGDRLSAERKFKESFEFQPFCRLVFSANYYPICRDASLAFFRRWVVLPFDQTFPKNGPNHIGQNELVARLSSADEKSGLLNIALEAFLTFREREQFFESETSRRGWREFRDQTDPLAQWFDQFTISLPDAFVTRKKLSIRVNAWLREQDRAEMDQRSIFSGIRRLRPKVTEKQRVIKKQNERGFLGLKLI